MVVENIDVPPVAGSADAGPQETIQEADFAVADEEQAGIKM